MKNYKQILKNATYVFFIAVIVFELVILGKLLMSNKAIADAVTLATTRQPERFTELYFENHLSLPKDIIRFKKYKFAFTIHNLEYRDTEYPYRIYLQRETEKILLNRGKVSLKQDEYKTITEEFGPLKNIRSKIVVELTAKNQMIHFWMGEENK